MVREVKFLGSMLPQVMALCVRFVSFVSDGKAGTQVGLELFPGLLIAVADNDDREDQG